MRCENCRGIDFRVVESRLLLCGSRRRRWECNNCAHRWTIKQENAGPVRERRCTRQRLRGGGRTLTDAEAATIMLSANSTRQLAQEYGVTHQAIAAIKAGRTYRDVFAALGLNPKGCRSCQHWSQNRCSFEFPEAGGDFSLHCSLYQPHVT